MFLDLDRNRRGHDRVHLELFPRRRLLDPAHRAAVEQRADAGDLGRLAQPQRLPGRARNRLVQRMDVGLVCGDQATDVVLETGIGPRARLVAIDRARAILLLCPDRVEPDIGAHVDDRRTLRQPHLLEVVDPSAEDLVVDVRGIRIVLVDRRQVERADRKAPHLAHQLHNADAAALDARSIIPPPRSAPPPTSDGRDREALYLSHASRDNDAAQGETGRAVREAIGSAATGPS